MTMNINIVKVLESGTVIYFIIAVALIILWISAMFAIRNIRDSIYRVEDKQERIIKNAEEINFHLRNIDNYITNKSNSNSNTPTVGECRREYATFQKVEDN